MPEKPQSPFLPKEIDEPARPGAGENRLGDRPALILVNTFELGRLWRALLSNDV
jgi:hypothetical protein